MFKCQSTNESWKWLLCTIIHQIFALTQSIKSFNRNLIDQINKSDLNQSIELNRSHRNNLFFNTNKATWQSHIITVHPNFDLTDTILAWKPKHISDPAQINCGWQLICASNFNAWRDLNCKICFLRPSPDRPGRLKPEETAVKRQLCRLMLIPSSADLGSWV